MRSAAGTRGRSPGRPEDAAGARGRIPDDTPGAVAVSRSCAPRPAIRVLCARVPAVARGPQRGWVGRGSAPGQCAVRACGRGRACEGLRVPRCIGARVSRACARDGACAVRPSRAGRAERGTARVAWMAVVFHLLAFASVFDIYFRSPIVNGMAQTPQPPGHAVRVCGSARTHARTHAQYSKQVIIQHTCACAHTHTHGHTHRHSSALECKQAKRVVVIVADGGRADMVFDGIDRDESISGKSPLAVHLRAKILAGETSWGVSHTRVPTEVCMCVYVCE